MMDMLKKLPRAAQVVLAAAVLYLIFSFFDWQQVSFSGITAGVTEWHGIGVLAGLLVIALIGWEVARLFQPDIELGPLTPGLVSVGLALLLLIFTVITFLTHGTARHWPAWLGLLLSIVIAGAAISRAKAEGVELPDMSAKGSKADAGQDSGGSSPTPPAASDAGAPSQPGEAPPPAPNATQDPGA
jgi:hypothetical protein